MKKTRINRVVPLGLQTTRAVRDLRSRVSTLAVMLAWNTISLAPMTLTMVVMVLGLPFYINAKARFTEALSHLNKA